MVADLYKLDENLDKDKNKNIKSDKENKGGIFSGLLGKKK